ncbi:MAG: TraM recognition domain-containing protein [Anaerolineae bacterium]|nr:TraM recognition domain-containing protein [Anaerolineae bacterium]
MKNFFLNREFRPARFNLLWDGLLLWFSLYPILDFGNLVKRHGLVTYVMMTSLAILWFAWRRAWIQKTIQSYYRQQAAAEFAERQQLVEQEQKRTLADVQPHPVNPSDSRAANDEAANTSLSAIMEQMYAVYAIAVPLTTSHWSDSQAVGFLRALFTQTMDIQLAIVGQHDHLYWELTCYRPDEQHQPLSLSAVQDIAQAYYPGAQVKQVKRDFAQPKRRRYLILVAQYDYYFDTGLSASSIRNKDPLLDVVRVCSHLREGEQVRYVVSVLGVSQPSQNQIQDALMVTAREVHSPQFSGISTSGSDAFVSSVAGNLLGWVSQEIQLRGTKLLRFSEAQTEVYLKKLTQPLVYGFVSIEVDAAADRVDLLRILVGAVEQMTAALPVRLTGEVAPSQAYLSPPLVIEDVVDHIQKSPAHYVAGLTPTQPGQVDGRDPFLLALTLDELAGLWHLPTHLLAEMGDRIEQPSHIPQELVNPDPTQAVILGTADRQPIGVPIRDLNLHIFVAGMQGMGKSTLLHNITHQLISQGQGVAILDPHRTLINNVLATTIDDQTLARTVLLEAEDREYPIPLNPMRATPGMSQDHLFSSLMWVIKAIYAKSWSEGQMERLFRNVLQVILTDPEATPLDIQKLLEDPNYRRRAIASTRKAQGRLSHALEDFWERFDAETASAQRDRTSPVLNRLGVFLDGAVELMMVHPFGLNFRTIIQDKKVVLFDLGGGSLLSEADNLGSIFFAMLFFHAYALGEIQEGEPPRYYVILDETHRFVRAPIQQMFSEARKYGLSLILADQWLGQLEESTRQGIVNNKGTTISFRVAPEQAKDMAKLLEPDVTAEQLVKQGRGEAAVATVYNACTLPAFTLKTLPPPPMRFDVQQQRQQAKENLPSIMFSPDSNLTPKRMTVAEIDAWLKQRYTSGVFARDLQAETTYEDSVPIVPADLTPPNVTQPSEDIYTDDEEVE